MTRIWIAAGAALMLVAGASAAGQQGAPPRLTVQQQFDAASQALAEQNWAEALRLFEALEARIGRTSARNLAVVRVRKAQALVELGRTDEAAEALRLGLPALPAGDRSLDEDRFIGHVQLGRIAELRVDYPTALGHYRTARTMAVSAPIKVAAYRGLVQTQMFFDAAAALRDVDEALAVAAAAAPSDRQLEAQYRTLRGRVLLNMGRFAEAREELEQAMRQLGGLTLRVDLRDLVARSDLAIAAALAGNHEAARRYLAYTGAGRMRRASPTLNGRIVPPLCGDGLRPEDVAVVEFSIRNNGTVGHASPIYSSRQGEAALLFARAVSEWWWAPSEIEDIEPLFRAAIRVGLRCSERPLTPGDFSSHQLGEIQRWSEANGIRLEPHIRRGDPPDALRAQVAELERRHGRTAPQLLVPLLRLGTDPELRPRDRIPIVERALAVAAAARVPAPYLMKIGYILYGARAEAEGRENDRPDYATLLAEPALRSDPYFAAAAHLGNAQWLYVRGRFAAAAEALARARAVNLPAGHPLMPELLDTAAAVETARGNDDAARAAWSAIPAGVPRCLLPPHRRPASVDWSDFPSTALRWGFEGWTIVESLVGRRGPVRQRTIIAYPPFVFDRGSEEIAAGFRYEGVFEPESGPCMIELQRFRFEVPGAS